MTTVLELNREACKGYLISSAAEAAAIDPLLDKVDRFLSVLAYRGLRLRYVIDTHTHADHRTGARMLADLAGAPVVMHRAAPSPAVDRHVEDGQALPLGETSLAVLHTPGHTPDATSLLCDGNLFSGDTLLIRGTGRTDFLGGDSRAQFESLHGRLLRLPPQTVVWPGHDYRGRDRSTIGEEIRENPRLQVRDKEDYVRLMSSLNLPLPAKIQEALQANQSALDPERFPFPETAALAAVRQMSPGELDALQKTGRVVLLDVRELAERSGDLGHIAGTLHIPLRELPARAEKEVSRDRAVVAICRSGGRSATAAALLTGLGYPEVYNLNGGMVAWVDWGGAVVGRA
jgi:glyoxylase-like metal-dependent hydrolase (beta-lactamase superfamily II)